MSETAENEATRTRTRTTTAVKEEEAVISSPRPLTTTTMTMTVTLLLYWVLPVLFLSVVSRFAVETSPPPSPPPPRPISLDLGKNKNTRKKGANRNRRPASPSPTTALSKMPISYQEVVRQIKQRRPKWKTSTTTAQHERMDEAPTVKEEETPPKIDAETPSNPKRRHMDQVIQKLRDEYHPDNVLKAIELADALRQKDLIYHDGGSGQAEALDLYRSAIDRTLQRRSDLIHAGKPTTASLSGTSSIREELILDYGQKSVDGLLCALHTAMGKQYFMANMFERAVESYGECIQMEPLYLDALNSRGSSLIILGRYADAAHDLTLVIENDAERFFKDAFTGMAKVLTAKEDAVPQGWDPMIHIIQDLIPKLESQYSSIPQAKSVAAEALNRLYHVIFTYHDVKTNDTQAAWKALLDGYRYKMSVLEPFSEAYEKQKVMQIKQIFHGGFWPAGVGSSSQVPIFIIGFVRSGSTLLERLLDAHPLIVGTGEDSVFNGRLDYIRNSIVKASMSGSPEALGQTVQQMADEVVVDMRKRWQVIDANTDKAAADEKSALPQRFADKMLSNYFNVGFIHLLFPKALILHVVREPMDTIFSAFKHEFPPGTLDYTSQFSSLSALYHSYRDVMEHWDDVLPGRVTHVRYEDMVHDMPGMAKSIIEATGLPWDEEVLNFHKKKQAVNTLSTTQVRKGVYKHSLQAWKRYEEPLQPLVKLIGKRVDWDLKTTLPSYHPPQEA